MNPLKQRIGTLMDTFKGKSTAQVTTDIKAKALNDLTGNKKTSAETIEKNTGQITK